MFFLRKTKEIGKASLLKVYGQKRERKECGNEKKIESAKAEEAERERERERQRERKIV